MRPCANPGVENQDLTLSGQVWAAVMSEEESLKIFGTKLNPCKEGSVSLISAIESMQCIADDEANEQCN